MSETADVFSDPQLIEAARDGDQDAFGELLQRHHRRCLNLATSILRDRGEAEEETQNACWKAFEQIDRFRGNPNSQAGYFGLLKINVSCAFGAGRACGLSG